MAENICNGNHQYGLWNNNSRTCIKCGYTETLPLTDSIKLENLKQQKAEAILNKFLTFEDNSLEAIQGIQNILENHLNYLAPNALAQFQDKTKRVGIANNLPELSIGCIISYINKIISNEPISEETHFAFETEFMSIFTQEIKEIISNTDTKKATLS